MKSDRERRLTFEEIAFVVCWWFDNGCFVAHDCFEDCFKGRPTVFVVDVEPGEVARLARSTITVGQSSLE